jgi:dienelactone hydrolase
MLFAHAAAGAEAGVDPWPRIAPAFVCPARFQGDLGSYRSPLKFADGTLARTPAEWARRRAEIVGYWTEVLGPWPELLHTPRIEVESTTNRDGFIEQRVTVDIDHNVRADGILLTPRASGRRPAVLVPFYEPETSVGRGTPMRDFARQLTERGFVTLSIGSPGGDARRPDLAGARCQPLSYLAYIAANCHTALAGLTNVDGRRIGVVGHSYGGKWAMFASCLYDKFACATWSDPGVVFDEKRPNVNYWEHWYLGDAAGPKRPPGAPSAQNGRVGAYKRLVEEGHDLHELHALMAPRPFLVSGGSEDQPERWRALNHAVAVNAVLGATNRVAMTNRAHHDPTAESNETLCLFFEHFLNPPGQ